MLKDTYKLTLSQVKKQAQRELGISGHQLGNRKASKRHELSNRKKHRDSSKLY